MYLPKSTALFEIKIEVLHTSMYRFSITSKQLGFAFFALSGAVLLMQRRRRKSRNANVRMIHLDDTVSVSCPGKVLIAGGYLVLERPNVGITIAGTSRFFTTVKFMKSNSEENHPPDNNSEVLTLIVYSPQFYEEYRFHYNFITEKIQIADKSSSNTFVEKCLSMTMGFIKSHMGTEAFVECLRNLSADGFLGIKLRADNDFYSQAIQVWGA